MVDIDRHSDADDPRANRRAARSWYGRAAGLGLNPLLLDSNGRGGYHLWLIFNRPIPTEHAFHLGRWLTRDWPKFFGKPPESFPKSPSVNEGGFGTWCRLPGRHHKRDHLTRVGRRRWITGWSAVEAILRTTGADPGVIPAEALDYAPRPTRSPRNVSGAPPRTRRPSGGVGGGGGVAALPAVPRSEAPPTRRARRLSPRERARRDMSTIDPAVQGQRGSDTCFRAAWSAPSWAV